jgi:hypothetical protein
MIRLYHDIRIRILVRQIIHDQIISWGPTKYCFMIKSYHLRIRIIDHPTKCCFMIISYHLRIRIVNPIIGLLIQSRGQSEIFYLLLIVRQNVVSWSDHIMWSVGKFLLIINRPTKCYFMIRSYHLRIRIQGSDKMLFHDQIISRGQDFY